MGKLLLGSDRVLRGFGDAELHDGLRLDLDRFAGLRVASGASLAVRLYQAAQAGHDKKAILLGFFDCGVREMLKERRRGLVGKLCLLSQQPDQLSFGQTCSHTTSSEKSF